MELAGDMPEGTTAAIRKMLDANPKITVIHLNSDGGELREGYRLSELIKQRHLTTYTSTVCASACTIAFLAGSPRYLAEGAWLGFHSSSDKGSEEASAEGNKAFYDMYRAAGLPDDFIAHALSTMPSEIWFPSYDEMRAAHVVHDFVDRSKFATSGIAYWKSAAEVDHMLQEDDLYAAMAAHDATGYARIQEIFLTGAKLGRRIDDIEDDASDVVIDQLLPFYIRKSADEPILRFQRAYVAKLDYLTEHAPQLCAAQMFPELGLPRGDAAHFLPQSIKREIGAALADVAASAFEQGRQSDSSGALYMAKMRYYRHLKAASPEVVDVLDSPVVSRENPAKLCHAVADFHRDVLDQPTTDAAMFARGFWGDTS
jgi:hypothetical protein